MTEQAVKEEITNIPIGSKMELVMKNGDIIEVVLASHDTEELEEKIYGDTVVPKMPAALIVQGKRWGTYRLDIADIVNIAHIASSKLS